MGWRTKSIAQVQSDFDRGELKRSLGPIHLILFGIGCIIGAGIFVRTGTAAAQYAGPAVMISFIIAGVVCAFAGLCYAELASMLPVSGSAYTYTYTTVGEFGAWIMGALLLLEYALAASVVAVGWSGYAVSLLHDVGINLPINFTRPAVRRPADVGCERSGPGGQSHGVTATLADGTTVQFVSEHGACDGSYRIAGAIRRGQRGQDGVENSGYALTNALDMA
jgi:APA family basic amino acid/polyamine antiporter